MGKLARINAKKREDDAVRKTEDARRILRETKDTLMVPLLFQACANNDVTLCHEILKLGVPVDSRNHQQFYSYMYDNYVPINCIDENGTFEGQACRSSVRTPLIQCARNGHESLAMLFIRLGADVNAHDDDGSHLWHVVAANGMRKLAELLKNRGISSNQRDAWHRTPLHFAAVNMVTFVLSSGCEKDAQDGEEGLTAMGDAVRHDDSLKFFALLEAGCSVDSITSSDLIDSTNHRILGTLRRLRPDLFC